MKKNEKMKNIPWFQKTARWGIKHPGGVEIHFSIGPVPQKDKKEETK